jgi:hypothetical protein
MIAKPNARQRILEKALPISVNTASVVTNGGCTESDAA